MSIVYWSISKTVLKPLRRPARSIFTSEFRIKWSRDVILSCSFFRIFFLFIYLFDGQFRLFSFSDSNTYSDAEISIISFTFWWTRNNFSVMFSFVYASVNSSCAQHPPPPRADPRALAFFLPSMANSREWGLLSCQIPRGGDEKRGQMPRPPSTLQHFSRSPYIAQSSSAILSILMDDFLFQLTSSFVIVPF